MASLQRPSGGPPCSPYLCNPVDEGRLASMGWLSSRGPLKGWWYYDCRVGSGFCCEIMSISCDHCDQSKLNLLPISLPFGPRYLYQPSPSWLARLKLSFTQGFQEDTSAWLMLLPPLRNVIDAIQNVTYIVKCRIDWLSMTQRLWNSIRVTQLGAAQLYHNQLMLKKSILHFYPQVITKNNTYVKYRTWSIDLYIPRSVA